jgi:hypothetical protein
VIPKCIFTSETRVCSVWSLLSVCIYVSTAISVATTARNQYVPRCRNELHTIFECHFADFCEQYDEKYAATYGRYRLERIQQMGERFCTCGDYLQGVARIRCTNPECGHDYFRPFSCKGFYLCPSCSRKRTILFAEHLTNEVLLKLPHRQFVFTMPKALRPFFRHDRRLFAEVSRLIHDILRCFYQESAGRPLLTGMVIAHLRFFAKRKYLALPHIRHYRASETN